jgi:lipopolysaccharide transport system ATP-binding protein
MKPIAIKVRGIGKRYRLGAHRRAYRTVRETLAEAAAASFRLLSRPRAYRSGAEPSVIWALHDVSLDVQQGEVIGLIGRNGAGKSTLLKILARITEPTVGSAELRGRVASLLEVGTGFHSELTGRENIFLSGAILGMKRAEIIRNFDAIVAFAEVEPFIDTPIKHYSSGMHMRLAFAVAAHLEPEILLIDEVLAVGDVHFQKKCLAKMEDVGHQGRTVVFVSHSMPAVTRLCPRTILLDDGAIVMDGQSQQVASAYMKSGEGTSAERVWSDVESAPGNEVIRLRAVRLRRGDGRIADTIDIRDPVGLEMEYDVLQPGRVVVPHFSVHNLNSIQLFSAVETDPEWKARRRPIGRYISTGWIPGNYLAEGTLIVGAAVNTLNPSVMQVHVPECVGFCVIDSYEGDSARGDLPDPLHGVVRPMLTWKTRFRPHGNDEEVMALSGLSLS